MKTAVLLGIIGLVLSIWLLLPHLEGAGGIPGKPIQNPLPVLPTPTPTLSGFGALLGGVTAAEKAAWGAGRIQFQVVVSPEAGLGPIFNGQSCFQCHTQPDTNGKPVIGGAGAVTETRFGTPDGTFDLIHQACLNPSVQDGVPFDASIVAHRKSNHLFGFGFLEAIPDSTIIAGANVAKPDGIKGRAAVLNDSVTNLIATGIFPNGVPNKVGRFGWKCQQASLLAFSADASINELGVTNRFFTTDFSPHLRGTEPVSDAARDAAEPAGITATTLQDTPLNPGPENGDFNSPAFNPDNIDRFTVFMQLNAPPPPVPLSPAALRGQAKFSAINCASCHTPSMTTGASKISATLSFKPVPLYSDLLLHDMGTLNDGVAQAAAGPNEMRTAPLFGLRGRSPFLHDGRAATVFDAIRMHDGEAAKVRDRFLQLPAADQADVLTFLNSI
jgi:CxxC motif-containing protein (DUF1111 family)